jgi:hypothetical protein
MQQRAQRARLSCLASLLLVDGMSRDNCQA